MQLPENEANAVIVIHATHYDHFFRYGWVDDTGQQTGIRLLPDVEKCVASIGNLIDRIAEDENILRGRLRNGPRFEWPPSLPILSPVTHEHIKEILKYYAEKQGKLSDIANKVSKKKR